MIEKLVTSKTRIKILKLFLSHIDDRYYLRELERMLDESLSPLRRQLVKLTGMGILITEEEANLKYYRLNKNFEGLEELKELVLGKSQLVPIPIVDRAVPIGDRDRSPRQFRYDLAILSFVSVFVLATAMFVVYANNKNINMVSGLVVKNQSAELASVRSATPAQGVAKQTLAQGVARESALSNGEMASKKWKVMPGNIPVLSSVETGAVKNSKEL